MASKKYYLYHAVAEQFTGDTIYPLNQLKKKYPELYGDQVRKYEGREYLMQYHLPRLNCLWNDVVHLCAVHPKIIYQQLQDAGFFPTPWSCFEIDPLELNLKNLLVYWYRKEYLVEAQKNDFELFQVSQMRQLARFPEETFAYYQNCWQKKNSPLYYHHLPHLFYKGTISIKDREIVSVLDV